MWKAVPEVPTSSARSYWFSRRPNQHSSLENVYWLNCLLSRGCMVLYHRSHRPLGEELELVRKPWLAGDYPSNTVFLSVRMLDFQSMLTWCNSVPCKSHGMQFCIPSNKGIGIMIHVVLRHLEVGRVSKQPLACCLGCLGWGTLGGSCLQSASWSLGVMQKKWLARVLWQKLRYCCLWGQKLNLADLHSLAQQNCSDNNKWCTTCTDTLKSLWKSKACNLCIYNWDAPTPTLLSVEMPIFTGLSAKSRHLQLTPCQL